MFQQLLNSVFKPDKKIVSDIFFDIDLLYGYISNNGQVFDEWYFKNIFTIAYWNYLNNYSWLSNDEQARLHQGILSMILFLLLLLLEDKNKGIEKHLVDISKSLYSFKSNNSSSLKLCQLVRSSIKLLERKKTNGHNEETNTAIYKSISWTLKNIILADNEMPVGYKSINRRQ
ncbi:MAG: hypothetical protein DRI89_15510 [Bacteroidetes bacterium]|nr:MAG: hypothetical protein DRI89_15510 [Bacteroidota bacterium]